MKIMLPIFKIEVLIYQSEDNLCVKILFGKIIHLIVPEIDLLPILRRTTVERYFAILCRIFECAQ